jgi:hypothetical protein
MERQSKESRNLEAHCKGGQGPPRAVAPSKKKKKLSVSDETTWSANHACYSSCSVILADLQC